MKSQLLSIIIFFVSTFTIFCMEEKKHKIPSLKELANIAAMHATSPTKNLPAMLKKIKSTVPQDLWSDLMYNLEDEVGRNILHHAKTVQEIEEIKLWTNLYQCSQLLLQDDECCMTPLHYHICKGNTEVAQILTQLVIDLEMKESLHQKLRQQGICLFTQAAILEDKTLMNLLQCFRLQQEE